MRPLILLPSLALLLAACDPPPSPAPVPAPEPAPVVAAQAVPVCILRDGALTQITAMHNPQTNETTVDGRPFAEAHPATNPPYATGAEWFRLRQPIPFRERSYAFGGAARVLTPPEVVRVGEHNGVPLFAAVRGATGAAAEIVSVLFVPVRPGCEFQPYNLAPAAAPAPAPPPAPQR